MIIGIGTELHVRDMEIKALYDKRTFTGQLAQQKKHFAEELISYPDAPEEPVSASDLIRQQQEILARNGENQRLRAQYTELERQENTRRLADTTCRQFAPLPREERYHRPLCILRTIC